MSNFTNNDPLEGKGEEMIPEKGLPFDDIDKTPLEDIPPEERIPDYHGEDLSIPKQDPVSEAEIESDEKGETTEPFEATEPSFELSETETEALLDDADIVEDAFGIEETPWDMTEGEAETFIGHASEAFSPDDDSFDDAIVDEAITKEVEVIPPEETFDELPEDIVDEGMGTHLEDTVEVVVSEPDHPHPHAAPVADHSSPGPEPVRPDRSMHKHDHIVHAGQPAVEPMVDLLISDEDMQALWQRAKQAQNDITRHIKTIYIARPMLDQIQAGRNELMAGKEYYEDAERHIAEAEYRVQLSIQLEKLSKQLIPRLFIYLAAWFIALIVSVFIVGGNMFTPDSPILFFLAGSMIFGGIGGILGASMAMIKHYSKEQDFSARHTSWYIQSPFIGVAMGAIIFVIMSAGVISISAGVDTISSPFMIYIVAGMAGYQHNVFTDLVKRMAKVLEVEDKEKSKAPDTNDLDPPPDEA